MHELVAGEWSEEPRQDNKESVEFQTSTTSGGERKSFRLPVLFKRSGGVFVGDSLSPLFIDRTWGNKIDIRKCLEELVTGQDDFNRSDVQVVSKIQAHNS